MKNKKNISVIVLLLLVCLIPMVITNTYTLKIFCNVMLYAIIAMSINLIVGFSGQLDFGRGAFAALGGYFSAICFTTFGVPFLISFIGGGLFAMLFGAILGTICRHSSFDYLTLITIGFNEIVRLSIQNMKFLTGGSFGFQTGRPKIFGFEFKTHQSMFYFCLVLLVICYILIHRLTQSKMGRAFKAIRDDSLASSYAGIDVPKYKMYCFTIGSFFTGIAGAAMIHYTKYASPTNYTTDESLIMLQMAILGGLGSLPGSIIGALILVVLPEISRSFYQYRLLFMGILMVVLMLFAPNGLLGRGGVKDKLVAYMGKKSGRKEGK